MADITAPNQRHGTCSICGGPYLNYGNNADPFPARACNECDNRFVTPARIFGVSDHIILALLIRFARQGRQLVLATARARVIYSLPESET
jgi:hypothetical protein